MIITAPLENKEEIQYKPFCNVDPAQTTINFFNNKSDSYSTNSDNMLVGGRNQEWKQILENIGQKYVRQPNPQLDGEEMNNHGYVRQKFDVEKLKNPYILDPNDCKTQQELFNAIKHWWVFKKRKHINTVKKRIPMAQRMSEHPVFPINWKKLNPNQIIA